MNALLLLLGANGISPDILKDPTLKMLIDEGDGVDAMRYIEKKSHVNFSPRDKLHFIEALETYQFVEPTRDSILNVAGREGQTK